VLMADHGECLRAGAAVHANREAPQPARRVPHEQRALAPARPRAPQLADPRARRGRQEVRRAAEEGRARRGDRVVHRVQPQGRRRDGRPARSARCSASPRRCRARASRWRRGNSATTRSPSGSKQRRSTHGGQGDARHDRASRLSRSTSRSGQDAGKLATLEENRMTDDTAIKDVAASLRKAHDSQNPDRADPRRARGRRGQGRVRGFSRPTPTII